MADSRIWNSSFDGTLSLLALPMGPYRNEPVIMNIYTYLNVYLLLVGWSVGRVVGLPIIYNFLNMHGSYTSISSIGALA